MNPPRIGSLFTGYGGLDMAVQAALGGDVVWHCDNDPAASRLLAHRHPDVPNLGDITAVPWADLDRVDVLTGGFPCQDVSSAGRRAGLTPDSRSGLWTHMARAIHVLRPRLVVIENVRGLLSADAACDVEPCPWCLGDHEGRPLRALGAVLGDLAVLGYDARWHGLRAADAGAAHGRYRIFITAWPAADPGSGELQRRRVGGVLDSAAGPGVGEGAQRQRDRDTARDGGATAADTAGPGRRQRVAQHVTDDRSPQVRAGQTEPGRRDRAAIADADHPGLEDSRRQPGADGRAAAERDGGPTADTEGQRRERRSRPAEPQTGERRRLDNPDGSATADTARLGRGEGRPEPAGQLGGPDAPLGRATSDVDWGDYAPAIRRWELTLGRPAPAPTMTGARGGQQLSPLFVEWLMGLPAGWVTDVPGLTRNDQLKILGNGVVPQQAALALRHLLAPAGSERAA